MDWIEIASNPEATMAKYKDEAVKQATRVLLVQIGVFGLMSFIITDFVVRKYVKGR